MAFSSVLSLNIAHTMEWNPKETDFFFFSWNSDPLEWFPVLVWTMVQLPHPLSDPNILSELFFHEFPTTPCDEPPALSQDGKTTDSRNLITAGGKFSGSPYVGPHIST